MHFSSLIIFGFILTAMVAVVNSEHSDVNDTAFDTVKDRSKRALIGCPFIDGVLGNKLCKYNCYFRGLVTGTCINGVCICRSVKTPKPKKKPLPSEVQKRLDRIQKFD